MTKYKTGGKKAMYKKLYESPAVKLYVELLDNVIIMSGTGFDSDAWDNLTNGEKIEL